MQHGQSSASAADHSKMQHGESAASGADHSQHGATSAIPPGGLWGPVPGSAPAAGAHGAHGASAPLEPMTVTLGTAPAPRTSAEMSKLQPAATLRQDTVDLAAPISVNESAKASDPSHAGHGSTEQPAGARPGDSGGTAPADRKTDPRASSDPHAAHRAPAPAASVPAPTTPGSKKSATPKSSSMQATQYVCPMHPEVVSNEPGRCPKCGMALVKKEKQ